MDYVVNHIPKNTPKNRRPGTKMVAEFLTIHNTANTTSTAANERNWLVNTMNPNTASWHIAIDEKQAVEAIPLDEVAWHAGDGGNGPGNRTSIGIEVCESGNQEIVWRNAVSLVAKMLHERGWSTSKVKAHRDWSGKNCPRLILPRWSEFIADIEKELKRLSGASIPDWKKAGLEYLAEQGLITDPAGWLQKIDDDMPVWAVMTILRNIHENLKGEK